MSRLAAIRTAARPKMNGRAMLSGPSGAGKTWTGLGIATVLADGGPILVIDTEKESALTYADTFAFEHLPWRPPYDPTELADTLTQLAGTYPVVMIDSFTHFWRGQGGTLDIADGKIGGWKSARPVQERLVEAVLAMPCHMLLCVRSKMDYLVGDGGRSVTKLGIAPIQDETLVYEMNVALDIDLEHRITVTKSRTQAVPVGRMYPAGYERKAAEDYAAWLAGGVPPASREQVDGLVAMFAGIGDSEVRAGLKHRFVEQFGMPQALTADKAPEAAGWLGEQIEVSAAQSPPSVAAGDGTPGHGRAVAEADGDASTPASSSAPAEAVQTPDPAAAGDLAAAGEVETPPAAVEPTPGTSNPPGSAPERTCHTCGGPILPDQACRKVRNMDAYQHKTCPQPGDQAPPPPGGGVPSPSEETPAGQAEDPVAADEGNGVGAADDTLTGEDGGGQSTAAEPTPASKDPGQRGTNHRHIQALCTDLWSKHGPMSVAKRRHWLAGQVSGGRTESTNGLTVEEQEEMVGLLQRIKEGSLEPHRRATGEWELRTVPGSQPRQAVA